MHDSVMKWVTSVVKRLVPLDDLSVLEVGSYNVNGSVRPLFVGANYIGVDARKGPGVDIVLPASALTARFAEGSFDIVISTEMLEHDPAFWLSMAEMGAVLKLGGYLIITARGNGFPRHDYPGDYWRFTLESVPLLFDLANCDVIEAIEDTDKKMPGVFGWGRKR